MESENRPVDDILSAVARSAGGGDALEPQISLSAGVDAGTRAVEYREDPSMNSDPRMATGSKARARNSTLPGQQWSVDGTTCYNPLQSDPRVEAVLGKKVYRETVKVDRVGELEAQLAELRNIIVRGGLQADASGSEQTSADTAKPRTRSRSRK